MSAGKMFVELERARMTKMLAEIKEAEGNSAEAADVLQEVQVETVGSMEVAEKANFLLEQMRLCLAKKDYVRTEIVANKVNVKILSEEKHQELKLKYYKLLIEYHNHSNNYFQLCKANHAIFNTPSIQADPTKWKPVLTQAVIFLVLSPFDAEVSDLLHRIKAEKRMEDMPTLAAVLTAFTSDELMPWPVAYEAEWKADAAFAAAPAGKDRWADMRKRVVQHNIRVISQFYGRIRTTRLAQLLALDEEKTETYLSEMVSSKQLFAKIDRPIGIISFQRKRDANEVLNTWADDITELLSVVESTCHMINMDNMRKRAAEAAAKS